MSSNSSFAKTDNAFKSGYVGIVGAANAGKSTLLNSILGAKISIVSSKPQTTRNKILGVYTKEDAQIIFLDTPGFIGRDDKKQLNRFLKSSMADALSEVDFYVLVIDAAKAVKSKYGAQGYIREALQNNINNPAVVVLNKIDLVEKDELLPLISDLSEAYGEDVDFVPLSALKQKGIGELESVLVKHLNVGPQYFPAGTLTDQSEEFVVTEVIREKLFNNLNQELPYSIAVKVDAWQEKKDLLKISAVIVVERESQKGIVIGDKGGKLKQVGTQARIELEKMFGIKVFLKLFVRVDQKWSNSAKGLSRMGYSQ